MRPGCLPDGAAMSERAAAEILRGTFSAVQKAYIAVGLDKVRYTRLSIDPSMRDKDRHFAGCKTDGSMIAVAPDMALLNPKSVAAIMAHEFGHAADYLYPGSFMLDRARKLDVKKPGNRSNDALPRARVHNWQNRNDDVVEFTADAIAEFVTGGRIGYCGPCKIQAFLDGSPEERDCLQRRPAGLR